MLDYFNATKYAVNTESLLLWYKYTHKRIDKSGHSKFVELVAEINSNKSYK